MVSFVCKPKQLSVTLITNKGSTIDAEVMIKFLR